MSNLSSDSRAAIDFALSKAEGLSDINQLHDPIRTVVLVHTAQGVIDNGGLQYFFEADFPGKPSYPLFVEAYRRIGADDAASKLEQAVALFPFPNPHRAVRKRNAFMDRFKDEEGEAVNSPFEPLINALCGNKTVWRRLDKYIQNNRKALGG
jgi:hypothetical protein